MRRSNNTNTAKRAGRASGKPGRLAQKALFSKILALALAVLLVFACAVSAFAKSGDGDKPAGDTTTIGADSPTGSNAENTGEQSATMNGSENSNSEDDRQTDPENERRKEIYTFMTLIALGAIIVGIREKRSKRRY